MNGLAGTIIKKEKETNFIIIYLFLCVFARLSLFTEVSRGKETNWKVSVFHFCFVHCLEGVPSSLLLKLVSESG